MGRKDTGVSPVIANILLIAVAVAATAVVVAFVSGMSRPPNPTVALVGVREASDGGLILEHKGGAPIAGAFSVSDGQMKWLGIGVNIGGVRAQVGEAYFNGTSVDQMPSGVYDFKVGDVLLIKSFSVALNPGDLVTVVSISSAQELVGKTYSGPAVAGVSYSYIVVTDEEVHEGGATGISWVQAADGNYENIFETSYGLGQGFNPLGYTLQSNTRYISGPISALAANDGNYMTFETYGQTLYTHQETATIGGSSYYLFRLMGADSAGEDLVVPMDVTGRRLAGRFVFPLAGITSIPASTWTVYYRAWRDPDPAIAFDAQSSVTLASPAPSISWSHTTGAGTNRLLLVTVDVYAPTGTPATVTGITYDGVSLTSVNSLRYNQIRSYVYRLVNPASGPHTITVNFSAPTRAIVGAVTYTGVSQTAPIQRSARASGTGTAPSVQVSVTGNGRWVFGHMGGYSTAPWTIEEGPGQTRRWGQTGELYKGVCSDKLAPAGSQSVSWSLDSAANYTIFAVVINPVSPPVGHCDVDILIRRSDGTVRRTLATNVANSGNLTSVPATLSGSRGWASYTVVDQTDYLELDYYVHVTTAAAGVKAYLRVDDASLAPGDQTRVANVNLPGVYRCEVEFTGSSNSLPWDNLSWAVDSRWTTDSVSVTIQLYNYQLGRYAQSGEDGYFSYTSGAANRDQTVSQIITIGPSRFRDASGSWKLKITGIKTNPSSFRLRVDWIELRPTISAYRMDVEHRIAGVPSAGTRELQIKYYLSGDSEEVYLSLYDWTAGGWVGVGSLSSSSPVLFAYDLTGTSYVSAGGEVRVRYAQPSSDHTQTSLLVDYCWVRVR